MRRPLHVLCSAFLPLTLLFATFAVVADTGAARADAPNDEFAFIDMLNRHRADAGLPGLAMSATLSDYARAHSAQMAASGGIFHSSNLAAIAGAAAPNWRAAGENVGVGGSVSVLDSALMNSAPHRANILGGYNYVGIGVAYNGNRLFVTEMFVSTPSPIAVRSRPGSSPPIGSVDAISRFQSQLSIDGWALDPDTSSSIGVHVYVDGAFATATTANGSRPDLAGYGRGTAHGFHATINVGPGLHAVCVFGINNAAGVNPVLSCQWVNMTSWPTGSLDLVTQSGDGLVAAGWALDPDTSSSIDAHVYVDGQRVAVTTADDPRADIGNVYPGYGNAHGFSVRAAASPGWHSVCVFAINLGAGGNQQLGCRAVYVASDPFGSVDVAAVGPGDLEVAGWLIDPSSSSPITGHVYVDGQFAGATSSGLARPDLSGLGFGSAHGFDTHVSIDGGFHQVCVFGINVGAGANQPVRCITTAVLSDPVGSLDGVSVDATPSGTTQRSSMPTSLVGWAIDPNTPAAVDVRVLVDGAVAATVTADDNRPDLAPYYPAFGTRHGYSTSVSLTPGPHNVCAVAVNTRAGSDRLLGCRAIAG